MTMRQPELEVYLRRATRGLSGARKLEVRSELEEHVLELAWTDQVRGVPQDKAILNALERLGSASSITRDMNRIYTLPLIVRASLLSTMLAALAFALLPKGLPQIAAFELPTPSLKENLQIISLSGLRRTLEPLGVQVQALNSKASLRFPQSDNTIQLELHVPATPGSIVAAITAPSQINTNYRLLELDLAMVDARGVSELFFRHAANKFVNSVQALRPGDHNIMLVRFTGRITANGPAFETIQPN